MPPWRLHDLRQTCATVMADRLGVQPHSTRPLSLVGDGSHVTFKKTGGGCRRGAGIAVVAKDLGAVSLFAPVSGTFVGDGGVPRRC